MLGIIIGVSSVIGILAIGTGWGQYFESELGKFGVGIFYVFPGVDSENANNTQTPQLTAADARALAEPGAAYLSPDSGEATEVAKMIAADVCARIVVLADLGLG